MSGRPGPEGAAPNGQRSPGHLESDVVQDLCLIIGEGDGVERQPSFETELPLAWIELNLSFGSRCKRLAREKSAFEESRPII